MHAADLRGVSRRNWIVTTVRDRGVRPAPDLVERNFTATAANRLWVADITYISTWAGFLYLATSCSTRSADASWAGPWRPTCAPSWCSRRATWRWDNGARPE